MLDERSERILKIIVESYINKPEPVGSRYIAKKYFENLSPATIRNVMADLEELGYLSQPHTSAGRIPTDKGYRYYVNHLIDTPPKINSLFLRELTERLQDLRDNLDLLLERTLRSMALYTRYMSLASRPIEHDFVLKNIRLKKGFNSQIMVSFVTEEGVERKHIIDTNYRFSQRELDLMADYLNSRFSHNTLKQIREALFIDLSSDSEECDALISRAIRICKEAILADYNIFIYGFSYVFELPDFLDLKKIRELVRTIENKQAILSLIDELINTLEVKVIIGSENKIKEFKDMSIVASPYYDDYKPAGTICLIGPKRMDYIKSIAIVKTVSNFITETLERLKHGR